MSSAAVARANTSYTNGYGGEGYVSLAQCQVLGACYLKQGLLAPGSQALRNCKHSSDCSAAVS